MNLRHLEVFHAIMLTGSVTGAARFLSISQPAVSVMLKHAESSLGITLFQRIGGRLTPTPEAEALLTPATNVYEGVKNFHRIAEGIRKGGVGMLSIGASPTLSEVIMPALIAEFCRHRPGLTIDLQRCRTGEIVDRLMRRELDVGVGFGPVNEDFVDAEHVGTMQVVCIMDRESPLAELEFIEPATLRGVPIITYATTTGIGRQIEQAFERSGVPCVTALTTNSHMACLHLVNEGVGPALTMSSGYSPAFPSIVSKPFIPMIEFDSYFLVSRQRAHSHLVEEFRRTTEFVLGLVNLPRERQTE